MKMYLIETYTKQEVLEIPEILESLYVFESINAKGNCRSKVATY